MECFLTVPVISAAFLAACRLGVAASVTINWPAEAGGNYEIPDLISRRSVSATAEAADDTYVILGVGWGEGLEMTVSGGVATISANPENVGIVAEGNNTFTFLAATIYIETQRELYWRVRDAGIPAMDGNEAITLIVAPAHAIDGPGLGFTFGLGEDGTVTLGAVLRYIAAEGDTITIMSHGYTCDPGGNTDSWQITFLAEPGGSSVAALSVETGVVEKFMSPGAYKISVNCIPREWMGYVHEFLVRDNGIVVNGIWAYNDEKAGEERTFTIEPTEPLAAFLVEGDATMDCKVNILDLIFIRNRLNQSVGTGDNWQADVNADSKINILDLIFVRNALNTQC